MIAEIVDDVKQRLPEVQPPPEIDDPDSARFRLFDSIATFLKNISQAQPLLLILDDLHWADKPSLMLLEFIAREIGNSRILLVGTYRDMELSRRHPLSVTLGDLTRERLFQRVLLRGLTRDDVARFIELAAGIDPPRGLIDAVHTQTEGNPFFITETVRYLVQEGELASGSVGDRDSWTVRIPEGVREVIGRRLDRLSERCNEVLTVASVIGRQFTLGQLRSIVEDVTEDQLLDVLDEALAARTIEEMTDTIGLYQFTHALIEQTLPDELSITRRVRLHARIVQALEALYGSAAKENTQELLRHFTAAETQLGVDKIVEYSLAAGEMAIDGYAYEEATTIFERALAAHEPDEIDQTRAELLYGLARADFARLEYYGRGWDAFREYFEKTGQRSRALAIGFHTPPDGFRLPQQSQLTERILGVAEKGTWEEARAQVLHAWTVSVADGDIEVATPHLEQALKLIETIDHPDTRDFVLDRAAAIAGNYLRLEECAEFVRSIPNLEDHQGSMRGGAGMFWGCASLQALGDIESSRAVADAIVAAGERFHWRLLWALGLARQASYHVVEGNWEAARTAMIRYEGFEAGGNPAFNFELQIELMSSGDKNRLGELILELSVDLTRSPFVMARGAAVLGLVGWSTGRSDIRDQAIEMARNVIDSSPPPCLGTVNLLKSPSRYVP